jgi:FixJ family two-component response regulator
LTPPLIAIIDDDDGIRNALQTLMRSTSFRAETFPSPEAFVASEIAANSDCIITEVAIRGMSGLELAGLLRSQGGAVPIILISALPDADLERQSGLQRRSLSAQETDRIRHLDLDGGGELGIVIGIECRRASL